MASETRPSGLIANKGLELLTMNTPNGVKASIYLEELKAAYPGKIDYVFQHVDITTNVQKEDWFTKYGPNGRIPVLIDHDKGSLGIQEGAAILSYLSRNYDTEHKFSFTADPELSRCEQWIAWQHGGLGPMQGQANHFYRFTKERLPYPTQRYVGETERLLGILDKALSSNEYLVGNKFSTADIASFGWVNVAEMVGIDLQKQFPNLDKWHKRISQRPAVQKGLQIPTPSKFSNASRQEYLEKDAEFKQEDGELKKALDDAREQYGYKYASP